MQFNINLSKEEVYFFLDFIDYGSEVLEDEFCNVGIRKSFVEIKRQIDAAEKVKKQIIYGGKE